MGCASSKLFRKGLSQDFGFGSSNCSDHVVSLTSTTYGFLKLDSDHQQNQPIRDIILDSNKESSPPREIINTWELMKDLEDEEENKQFLYQPKKSPNFSVLFQRSPLKLFNHMGSPKKSEKLWGQENEGFSQKHNYSPKTPLKQINFKESLWNSSPVEYFKSGFSSRRNLSPLFDPELVAFFEKELSEEEEQIKKMIFETPNSKTERNSLKDVNSILELYERKCPPGCENMVVIYTTTLRGIRKTFEECNSVRSTIESHGILFLERDISMDLGFKKELRRIMGVKDVKVPMAFVKGRLIGGVDAIVKLEEEGNLGILLDGMPRGVSKACEGCAGARFVMCMDCCGSCKVFDEHEESKVKCLECNENGLIQCPICC